MVFLKHFILKFKIISKSPEEAEKIEKRPDAPTCQSRSRKRKTSQSHCYRSSKLTEFGKTV